LTSPERKCANKILTQNVFGNIHVQSQLGTFHRETTKLEAIQRWSGDMSRVTFNDDLSKIPFVHF